MRTIGYLQENKKLKDKPMQAKQTKEKSIDNLKDDTSLKLSMEIDSKE